MATGGIRRKRGGWQAHLRYGGHYYSQQFPLETDRAEIDAWISELHAELLRTQPRTEPGSFAADAARYLAAVQAMPSIKTRQSEIRYWIERFGERPRRSIRPDEIRAQRDSWVLAGVAASTINHRLRALSNLYTVLDAGRAFLKNPVRLVPEVQEPDPEPRGLPMELAEAILDCIPDRGRAARGQARSEHAKTKARLRVWLRTGFTPATMQRIDPATDIHWDQSAVFVRRRQKGKGVRGSILPVTAAALVALREMQALDAFGRWSTSSVHRSFLRACQRLRNQLIDEQLARGGSLDAIRELVASLSNLRPTDLRHSFGTAIAEAAKDERAVQVLLQHATLEQTRRYTMRSIDPRLKHALAQYEQSRAAAADK